MRFAMENRSSEAVLLLHRLGLAMAESPDFFLEKHNEAPLEMRIDRNDH